MIIEGRNPVREVLRSDRSIEKILVMKGQKEGSIQTIFGIAREKNVIIQEVDRAKLDELSETKNHQGVMAIVSEYEYFEVEDLLNEAYSKNETPFLIILDEVTDPHNLGAIIRTANISGAHGIIIPKRRSVGLTQIVAKTSAGAIEYTKVAKVTNLNATIKDLKKQGIWVVAADMDGKQMYDIDFKMPIAIVIGAEGEGVSRLIKENCDMVASIPMKGQINSLNASVAAAILMYEVVRQRRV
ncbi:MAG TPA: 23S rRNA (guanosine(2251)-2'-O)-methyltransferase RlmB [Clostridiales bacterium]|nr:MAG: 23S rRNA (guanosine(2251)-2'-O)-methyltransferase RlmB [Clostridiales bacterium GWD2_32_59]HAN10739.1 23S rRNA (guanosine(2251)-2'-O)-methyltransferase RlmB [Clostridiales bacterium]